MIALSVATGVFKAVIVMIGTLVVATMIGLDNPRGAMVFGGLMMTVSGVSGRLAATDRYSASTATFHAGWDVQSRLQSSILRCAQSQEAVCHVCSM